MTTLTPLEIDGAWLLEPSRHADERGWFEEWFKKSFTVRVTGYFFEPVQANISKSSSGVIRGIHYSTAPNGQGKLVTVMNGAINDYVVDLSPSSPTYGKWVTRELTAENGLAMLIGPHMGHAFQALSDDTVVSYLVTAEYDPVSEKAISPYCPQIGIQWHPSLPAMVSEKDRMAPTLEEQQLADELPLQ